MTFQPEITAICCQYCSYAAADLAGSMRLKYPPNVKIVLMPCTGKMDILHVLLAFEEGADGVMILGCLEGSCHFLTGNLRARRRVIQVHKLLEEIGLEPVRLEMFNLSSAMGVQFAEVACAFSQKIQELGPSRMRRHPIQEAEPRPDVAEPQHPIHPIASEGTS